MPVELNTDAILIALQGLLSLEHILFLAMGTFLGLLIGVIPGLGGLAGLSLVLPFIYGMEPTLALALMIGMIAPTTTSDTFPAVLLGVPGTAGSQATVLDGFPLSKKGEAARALSASFIASMVGGIVGAIALSAAIVFAVPLIMMIGFAEQMLLIILALGMVGILSGGNLFAGLAACCLGLLIGAVGVAPATGSSRMTLGSTYLIDGFPLVVLGLGLFALPEIFDLLRNRVAISERPMMGEGRLRGLKDAVKYRWLILRCSVIGSLLGALPGLGGSVIDWITYGHVVQSSRDKSNFGKGDIRGVLAPESANNAKEGGALVPTLLFGIPGSGTMAILIGGFILIGIEPGAALVTRDLDITYLIIWSLALANVIGALTCLLASQYIARLTAIPFIIIAPIIISIIVFAAGQASRSMGDLVVLFAFGVIGLYFKQQRWSRPALLIGFVLSTQLETTVYQTIQIYGLDFLSRPQSQLLVTLIIISVASSALAMRKMRKQTDESAVAIGIPWVFGVLMLLIAAGYALLAAQEQRFLGQVFPVSVAVALMAFVMMHIMHTLYITKKWQRTSITPILGWGTAVLPLAAAVASVYVLGVALGILVFTTIFLSTVSRVTLIRSLLAGLLTSSLPMLLGYVLSLRFPQGLINQYFTLPATLGG
jgi:putative tricarboxylic transport membrane protein